MSYRSVPTNESKAAYQTHDTALEVELASSIPKHNKIPAAVERTSSLSLLLGNGGQNTKYANTPISISEAIHLYDQVYSVLHTSLKCWPLARLIENIQSIVLFLNQNERTKDKIMPYSFRNLVKLNQIHVKTNYSLLDYAIDHTYDSLRDAAKQLMYKNEKDAKDDDILLNLGKDSFSDDEDEEEKNLHTEILKNYQRSEVFTGEGSINQTVAQQAVILLHPLSHSILSELDQAHNLVDLPFGSLQKVVTESHQSKFLHPNDSKLQMQHDQLISVQQRLEEEFERITAYFLPEEPALTLRAFLTILSAFVLLVEESELRRGLKKLPTEADEKDDEEEETMKLDDFLQGDAVHVSSSDESSSEDDDNSSPTKQQSAKTATIGYTADDSESEEEDEAAMDRIARNLEEIELEDD